LRLFGAHPENGSRELAGANEEHASWATSLPVVGRCRELRAGTAILSADGDLLAGASAIWIELRDAAG
jgi:hypothetical protein